MKKGRLDSLFVEMDRWLNPWLESESLLCVWNCFGRVLCGDREVFGLSLKDGKFSSLVGHMFW